MYSEKHQLKDSSSSYYMESHKEQSFRHSSSCSEVAFSPLFLSRKVHSYRWFYMKDPEPKSSEADIRICGLSSQALFLSLGIGAGSFSWGIWNCLF